MDNKRLVVVTMVMLAVTLLWIWVGKKIHENKAWYPDLPPEQAQSQPAATGPSTLPSTQPATQPVLTAAPPATAPAVASGPRLEGGDGPPTFLGYPQLDEKRTQPYALGLNISPIGASLDGVVLNEFKEEIKGSQPLTFQKPYPDADPQLGRSLLTRGITLDGTWIDFGTRTWERTGGDDKTWATYQMKVFPSSTAGPLTITKRFEVKPRDPQARGYEVLVQYDVANHTGKPAKVRFYTNGPTAPKPENNRDVAEIVMGFDVQNEIAVEHKAASSYKPDAGEQPIEYKQENRKKMMWVGVNSAYFDAIVRPEPKQGVPIPQIKVRALLPAGDEGQAFTNLTVESPELDLPASGSASLPMSVYFGPRWREVLEDPYYKAFPRSYDKTLILTSGPCGYCTFDWLVNALVWMLNIFHFVTRDWGLAIIMLVLIVRLVLHPITKRSQVSMSRMSKMGPEIERLKKKYADQPDELNREMMRFYKEQGPGQILGCLPMFLQMPIWIALWSALQSTFELRHASFLWGFTWIRDLSQPDHVLRASSPFNFFFLHIDGLNLLPILMAVVFFFQQKLTPKPPALNEQQASQQKMMQWMSLLFPIFLYASPSGLNLYILTSTAIGIWESKRIRDHIKEREEKEKQLVIVDAPEEEPRRPAPGPQKGPKPAAKKKQGGIAGWLANLQEKADELRKDADKKNKKK